MSRNYGVVTEWLHAHFLDDPTHAQGEVEIGPHLNVHVVDKSVSKIPLSNVDRKQLLKFFETVVKKSNMGVLLFAYHEDPVHHAVTCVVDARRDGRGDSSPVPHSKTSKSLFFRRRGGSKKGSGDAISDRVVSAYFVDPNGSDDVASFPLLARAHENMRWLVRNVAKCAPSVHAQRATVRTYFLSAPRLNDGKTEDMERRDRFHDLWIEDENLGFCQPWAYALLLDLVCSPGGFERSGHFRRMQKRATRGDTGRRGRYAQLIYVRAVMTWIVRHMFDPSHPMYSSVVNAWHGPRPFDPRTATYLRPGTDFDL